MVILKGRASAEIAAHPSTMLGSVCERLCFEEKTELFSEKYSQIVAVGAQLRMRRPINAMRSSHIFIHILHHTILTCVHILLFSLYDHAHTDHSLASSHSPKQLILASCIP